MSKKQTKILSFLVMAVFVISIALAGCGGQKAVDEKSANTAAKEETKKEESKQEVKKVKIRFAHGWSGGEGGMGKTFPKLMEKFIAENKNKVDLVQEIVGGDEMRTKIKVDVAGGNAPDLWSFWGKPLVNDYATGGTLLDISEFLAVSKSLKKEDITDNAWGIYEFNGKIYGLPLLGYRGYFLANKNLFQKYNLQYPKTYEDMLAVAKVFNTNGIVPLNVTSKGGNPSHLWFSELYCQFDNGMKEIEDLGTTWKFDTENALKISKIIEDQRKNKIFPKDSVANGDWGPSFALYNEGKAAMCYSFNWMLAEMKPDIEQASEIIPVPKMPGATNDPAGFISGGSNFGLVINNKSFHDADKKQIITDLVDYIYSNDTLKVLSEDGGAMISKKGLKLDTAKVPKMLVRVIEYTDKIDLALCHYNTYPDTAAFTLLQNTLDELWTGAVTPEKFVEKVQKGLDKAKAGQK